MGSSFTLDLWLSRHILLSRGNEWVETCNWSEGLSSDLAYTPSPTFQDQSKSYDQYQWRNVLCLQWEALKDTCRRWMYHPLYKEQRVGNHDPVYPGELRNSQCRHAGWDLHKEKETALQSSRERIPGRGPSGEEVHGRNKLRGIGWNRKIQVWLKEGGKREIQSLQNLDLGGSGRSQWGFGFAMRRMGMTSVLMFSKEIWPCLVPTAWQAVE